MNYGKFLTIGKEGLLDLFRTSRNDSADQSRDGFDKKMKFRTAILEARIGLDLGTFYALYVSGLAPDLQDSVELKNKLKYQLRKFVRRVA